MTAVSWGNLSECQYLGQSSEENPPRMLEITHEDGSVKLFAKAIFDNEVSWFPKLQVYDKNSSLLGTYVNQISKEFGKFSSLVVYPTKNEIDESCALLLSPIRKIVSSYLAVIPKLAQESVFGRVQSAGNRLKKRGQY